MVAAICHFDLHLLDKPDSLKGKRHVVKRLRDRIASRLSVSVAEVGSQDLWHRAELGMAMVAAEQDVLEGLIDRIRRMIEGDGTVEVLESFVDYHRY